MTPIHHTAYRAGLIAVWLCGGAMATGCGGARAAAPPAATPTNSAVDDAATGLFSYHRFHHHGGVTLFIAMGLDTLGVSSERLQSVQNIRAALHERMAPARAAEQNLLAVLADGVAQGTIDPSRVDLSVAHLYDVAEAMRDASADALNDLHRVLTPSERAALVDKVFAHWSVWKTVNAEEAGEAHRGGGPLTSLGEDLGLTADQVNTIRASLSRTKALSGAPSEEVGTHLQAFGDAFRADTFDARALATSTDANARMIKWGAVRMARFVEAVSPAMTVAQRATFAEMLREHAIHELNAEGTS